MAAYEVLLLNTAVPQIQAAQAGDTYVVPRDIQITANLDVTGNTILGNASTDTVQVNGYMGVGVAPASNTGIYARPTALTGVSQYGVGSYPTATSAATTKIVGFGSGQRTAAASFTVTDSIGFEAANIGKGAGSTITNLHGVYIADQTQGTNNYGITSVVSSGTDKWNIYASGTAANYFAGRVLIGTTTSNAAFAGNLQYEGTSTDVSFVRYVNASGGPNIYFGHSRGASVGTNTIVQSGDVLGGIVFTGANGTGYDYAAIISGEVDGTPGASADMPGRIVFKTSSDGSATPTERLRITSDGYLRMASGTGGIQFNGDTAAANALDDYEEGTWTITLTPETSGSIPTNTALDAGSYTKVGRVVTVNGCVNLGSPSSPVGTYISLSLPFSIADLSELSGRFGGAVSFNDGGVITNVPIQSIEGETAFRIIMDASTVASGDQFYFSVSYFTS